MYRLYTIVIYYLFCVFGISYSQICSLYSCLYIFHLYETEKLPKISRFALKSSLKIEVFSERKKKKKEKKERKKKKYIYTYIYISFLPPQDFISSRHRCLVVLLNSERGDREQMVIFNRYF